MFRQNSGATTVEQTGGGLSQDAKLHAQAELDNWTGETDSEEEEGCDEGDDEKDDILYMVLVQ